jgi:hypothetical protein
VSDARQDWQQALAPTPECIDVVRFGEELDGAARTHLESCTRCQAELALYREMQREESTEDEAAAGQWIAGELQRRFEGTSTATGNVVPFRSKFSRALYAAAAAIVLVIGAAFWMQLREPSIDAPLGDPGLYRSARLDVIAPIGDLAQAPNELRWTAVPNASRYHVRIMEVDATVVWSSDTTEPAVTLPPAVVAQFAPGKSLSWDVQAFRGNEVLASSDTQTVRVTVTAPRTTP